MKKRILSILVLALCLSLLIGCFCQHEVWNSADCTTPKTCSACGEIEGEPLGHTWQSATCTESKTCVVCYVTEGDPLGHKWVDATYDIPKTCEVCSVTEGDPLPLPFLGTWIVERPCSTADGGFPYELTAIYHYTFGPDGTLTIEMRPENQEVFVNHMKTFLVEYLYHVMESTRGLDREAADAALADSDGMSIEELADLTLSYVDFSTFFGGDCGTYYMKDGKLHIDISFNDVNSSVISDPDIPNTFTVDGDTFTLNWESTGWETPVIMTRSTE